jgi:nucleolar complex protein 2
VAYAGFVKNSRVTTTRTLPHINFLKNTLSEIYGLDHSVTYPVAFPFIRQLAINLRNAMTTKTPQTQRIVYCWQYIHSLDFFSRTLSHHVQNKQSPLHPLLYPVIQIALGVVKLNPSAQFFPLRCYVVEGLLRVSKATDTYVPLAPTLLEPLDSALMKTRAAKKSVEKNVLKALELNVTLRVPTAYLSGPSSRVYRDQIAAHLTSLLYQFFDLYALNPAFPELVLPPVWNLKKWLKKHGGETSAKVRHGLQTLVEKLDEQAKWVEEQRQGMAFSAENLVGNLPVSGGYEGPLRKAVKARRIDVESISG